MRQLRIILNFAAMALITSCLFLGNAFATQSSLLSKISELAPLERVETVFEIFPETRPESQALLDTLYDGFITKNYPDLFKGNFFPSYRSLYELNHDRQERILKDMLSYLEGAEHGGDFEQFTRIVRMMSFSASSYYKEVEPFFNQSEYEQKLMERVQDFGNEISQKYPNENQVSPLEVELNERNIPEAQEIQLNSKYFGKDKSERLETQRIIEDYIQRLNQKLNYYTNLLGTTQKDPLTGKEVVFTMEVLKQYMDRNYIYIEDSFGDAKITFVGDSSLTELKGKPVYKIDLKRFPEDVFYFEHKEQPIFKKYEERFFARQQIAHDGSVRFLDKEVAAELKLLPRKLYELKSNFKDAFSQKGTNIIYGQINDDGKIAENLRYDEKPKQGSLTWMKKRFNAKFVLPKLDGLIMGGLVGAATSSIVLGIKHLKFLEFGGAPLSWELISIVSSYYLFWSIFTKWEKNEKYDGGGLKPSILKIEFFKSVPYYLAFMAASGEQVLDLGNLAVMGGILVGKSASKLSWKAANDFMVESRLNNTAFKVFGKKLSTYKWSDFHEFITGLAPRVAENAGLILASTDAVSDAWKFPIMGLNFLAVHMAGAITAKSWIGRKMKSIDRAQLTPKALKKWEKIDKSFNRYFGLLIKGGKWIKQATSKLRSKYNKAPSSKLTANGTVIRFERRLSRNRTCNRLF